MMATVNEGDTMVPNPGYAIVPLSTIVSSSLGYEFNGTNSTRSNDTTNFYDLAENIITRYVFGVVFVGGVIGNIVSLVVLQHEEFRQASMRFTLSALALVDTCLLVFGLLRQWLWELLDRDPRGENQFVCKTMYFAVYFFGQLSPWTIVILTLERSFSVFLPLKARTICSIKKVVTSWLLIAALLLILNLHTFWKVDLFVKDTKSTLKNGENATKMMCMHKDSWEYFHVGIWYWLDFIIVCVLPFLTIASCNMAIIVKLYKLKTQRRVHLKASPKRTNCGYSALTSMLVIVCVCFLATTTPLQLFFVLADLKDDPYIDFVMAVCNLLYYLNSATNFILYCLSGSIFRRAFWATFTRTGTKEGPSSLISKETYNQGAALKTYKSLPEMNHIQHIEMNELIRNNSFASIPVHKSDGVVFQL